MEENEAERERERERERREKEEKKEIAEFINGVLGATRVRWQSICADLSDGLSLFLSNFFSYLSFSSFSFLLFLSFHLVFFHAYLYFINLYSPH